MRAWCPSCKDERTVPFRAEGVQRCGHCAAPLTRPPAKRAPTRRPRRAVSPASPEQRAKIAGQPCVATGLLPDEAQVDPAHVIPRSLGGCDHPDCVVPLVRSFHGAYDSGDFDLLPFLEPRHRREIAHAIEHVGMIAALERITNERWRPVE